jgi:hypothetical protein
VQETSWHGAPTCHSSFLKLESSTEWTRDLLKIVLCHVLQISLLIKLVSDNSQSRFKRELTLSLTTLPSGFTQQPMENLRITISEYIWQNFKTAHYIWVMYKRLLTTSNCKCMDRSAWESNTCPANQEIPRTSQTIKFHVSSSPSH